MYVLSYHCHNYNNYDNNITIVIALLPLHKKMQEENVVYSLNRVEYNESYMRIFFEEDNKKELGELGYVKILFKYPTMK